jgi:hypothetical protein
VKRSNKGVLPAGRNLLVECIRGTGHPTFDRAYPFGNAGDW